MSDLVPRLSYSQQCAGKLLRLMGEDGLPGLAQGWTLEQVFHEFHRFGLPAALQSREPLEVQGDTLDRVQREFWLTAFGRAHLEFRQSWSKSWSQPVASFARLANPVQCNVVLHDLQEYRAGTDPRVLARRLCPFSGRLVMLERRDTFLALLVVSGGHPWASHSLPPMRPFDAEDPRSWLYDLAEAERRAELVFKEVGKRLAKRLLLPKQNLGLMDTEQKIDYACRLLARYRQYRQEQELLLEDQSCR